MCVESDGFVIELRTLGRLDLRGPDGCEVEPILAQPKRLALLAYFALSNSARYRRRDTALALFWPELDEEHARGALGQALRYLRRALGDAVVIARGREEVGVDPDLLWCDAVALRAAADAGRAAEALELYHGEFLEGFHVADAAPELEQWIQDERSEIRARVVRAAWARADEYRGHGEVDSAARWGRYAFSLVPDNESELGRLLVLLDRLGDRTGAIRAYDEFARRIRAEYATTPSPETQTLIRAIRERAPPPAASPPLPAPAPAELPLGLGAQVPVEDHASLGGPKARVRRWWRAPVPALLLLVSGAAAWLALGTRHPPIPASASTIAVIPFSPSGDDTALTRLGRDLVFTLTANLDGVGGIHAVDGQALLAHADDPHARLSLAQGSALGRRVGAGSVVHGSLTRAGDRVRVDLGLYTSDSLVAIARATVTNSPDSIAALTDSITMVLLRQIWRRGEPPSPSLDVALRTRSVGALRAFLDAEQAFSDLHLRDAADGYRRALTIDSTFWLAYARDSYMLLWLNQELDSTLMGALRAHRFELPDRERLVVEMQMQWSDSLRQAIDLGRRVTDRYPDFWFGWWMYGETLTHWGGLLAVPRAETERVLERAVALHPRLSAGWEHYMWVVQPDDDTVRANRGLEALSRLDSGGVLTGWMFGAGELSLMRLVDRLQRGDTTGARRAMDTVVDTLARTRDGEWIEWDPMLSGFPAAQIELSRRLIARGRRDPGMMAFHRDGILSSWAQRGAWDSALAFADSGLRSAADPSQLAGKRYEIAALGVWFGALPPEAARERRAAAARTSGELPEVFRTEVTWLDGLLAVARRDRAGFAAARTALRASRDSGAALQDSSLAAFDLYLAGHTREAAHRLAALEWGQAGRTFPATSGPPRMLGLVRLTAATWLLDAGEPNEAARLLTFDEAIFPHPSFWPRIAMRPFTYLQRARAEEALGHVDRARRYYRRFLELYDLPPGPHQHLVDEARRKLVELAELKS